MLVIDVTTQQGKEYRVTLDGVWEIIQLERDLGKTYTEIEEAIDGGSIDMTLQMIYSLAKLNGHTELKTFKAWVTTEYKDFAYGEQESPKASTVAESSTES